MIEQGGAGGRETGPVAVLFDLDGTLLELPVAIEPARREVEALLAGAGQVGPARPLLEAIDRAAAAVAAERGHQAGQELRAAARRILDAAEVAAAARARPMPGAAELVASLGRVQGAGPDGRGAAARIRAGIVTDNGRACLAAALVAAGLELAVPWTAVTRDEVERPKPAPDGVIAAARALLPRGGAVWMVGDSRRDLDAARAAAAALGPDFRLRAVAVPGGRGAQADLHMAADQVVAGLGAVAALVGAE